VSFAVPQFLVSNYHGPWLVDIIASGCSMICLALFLRRWRVGAQADGGKQILRVAQDDKNVAPNDGHVAQADNRSDQQIPVRVAVVPWLILIVIVFAWGTPQLKGLLNHLSAPNLAVPGLDKMVLRMPPVVAKATPEPAAFLFNWLSATGTAILVAALISGVVLRYSIGELIRHYLKTIAVVWRSLLTIAAMLALGYTTRYSGEDAILGLAFAHTGVVYPFFAAMLGWLGVALTGSDTSSNVLFGSLQKITANSLGLNPVLMAAANSSGGVMGKMIDAQSICVASTATGWVGHEWRILRFVFFHSLALASLVGVLVMLQQYVFTGVLIR
jgi:lactate permease